MNTSATGRRPGADADYHGGVATRGAAGAGGARGRVGDRSRGVLRGRGGAMSALRASDGSGASVAATAQAGRRSLAQDGLPVALETTIPVPAVSQGLHRGRSALRSQAAYDGTAAATHRPPGRRGDRADGGPLAPRERGTGPAQLAGSTQRRPGAGDAARLPRTRWILRAAPGDDVDRPLGSPDARPDCRRPGRAHTRHAGDARASRIARHRAGGERGPVGGLPPGGAAGATARGGRCGQVSRHRARLACTARGAWRTTTAGQRRLASATGHRATTTGGAAAVGRNAAPRRRAARGVDAEGATARALPSAHRTACGARARAMEQRGRCFRLARLRTHGEDAPPLARRGAELLAAPHHQRRRRGQTQPRQSAETAGLRLPEPADVSAQDPPPNPHTLTESPARCRWAVKMSHPNWAVI